MLLAQFNRAIPAAPAGAGGNTNSGTPDRNAS